MNNCQTFTFDVRGIVSAFAIMIAFVAAGALPVWAQHQGHDMQNMPGMDMPKPKPAPTPQKKKPTTKPQQDDMGNMPGINNQTPAPSPETPTPPQQMKDMPGMQMPSSTPSPSSQASPASEQKMEMNMPMTPANQAPVTDTLKPGSAPHSGDMGNMQMNENSDRSGNNSMLNMNGTGNMPGMTMNMGPLMVTSGAGDMGIRVGASQTNVLPMGQEGSGTSWNPASSPMYMYHKVAGDWLLMFHYNLVAGVNAQGGPLGRTKFESQNWFMPMAFHKLGRGTLQLRGMFSAEPFTFAPGGSGLLFQTGESYKGQPIRNAQHPHDLFMELSATYTVSIGERATWFTYFGYPGEPALGPPAFMHRWSASENPSATLGHHLEDSTHISFGVFTTGFTYGKFKLEGSIFNGQEPDENRYNFEAHKWNSLSARLSYAPNKNWTTQVSYGFLKRPEALEPDTDIRRVTASIQYNKNFNRGWWATSLIWGRNHLSRPGDTANQNGYTAESTVNFLDKNYLYTRLELVDRNELLNNQQLAQLGFTTQPNFRIGAYTFGGDRDIWDTEKISLAVGSDLTFYSKPAVLDPIYGQRPVSWRVFFRLRPGKMKMDTMQMNTPATVNGNMDGMKMPQQ